MAGCSNTGLYKHRAPQLPDARTELQSPCPSNPEPRPRRNSAPRWSLVGNLWAECTANHVEVGDEICVTYLVSKKHTLDSGPLRRRAFKSSDFKQPPGRALCGSARTEPACHHLGTKASSKTW